MRTPKGKRYCSDEAEMDQYRLGLKMELCPHCGAVGWLIGHGYLRGYGEDSSELLVRGRRFFCSNRGLRKGCGRTFSVLFARFIRSFMVACATLSDFLKGVRGGLSRKRAWEQAGGPFALETGYRLWNRLKRRQSRLRVLLSSLAPPPRTDAAEPIHQLIAHLESIWPHAECLVEAFQTRFQRSFIQ